MKPRIRDPFSASLAIASGLIVLLGYFLDTPLLMSIRQIFIQWSIILMAFALMIGVTNLAIVHWRKLTLGSIGAMYSAVILFSLIITIGVVGYFGPLSSFSNQIYSSVLLPIESSLMAILTVSMVYALARLLRRKFNLFSIIFLATVIIVLAGAVPLMGIEIPGLHGVEGLRSMMLRLPALAGVRGILLGVALGSVAAGLRVLLSSDRPYGG